MYDGADEVVHQMHNYYTRDSLLGVATVKDLPQTCFAWRWTGNSRLEITLSWTTRVATCTQSSISCPTKASPPCVVYMYVVFQSKA